MSAAVAARRPFRLMTLVLTATLVVAACGESSPPPGSAPAGVVLTLVAADIAYQPASFSIAAGLPIVVEFDHRDAGVPHGLSLLAGPNLSQVIVAEDPVVGPVQRQYGIAALVAGRYRFSCVVHPNMVADLLVGAD
jgi:plastocyanin